MHSELVVYIPAAQTARFHTALSAVAEGLAPLQRDKPLPVLDPATLSCLNLSLFGSCEHVRAPFAYPFLRPGGFNLEKTDTPLHEVPGLDWLVLGGDPADLARLAGEALTAFKRDGRETTLRVRPFATLRGPLPQEPRPGDTPFVLRKSAKNFNQPTWAKKVQQLQELPEERWDEVGISNTSDLLHIFDEALDRLVTRPPRLIIDLGCGLGQIARSLAQRYPSAVVVGVDASAEAIAVARKRFRLKNLKYAAVDFSKPLNFNKGSVDLIVSTNALPYAQDQLGAARELFGLLAPDGVLLNHCRAEESHMFWDFPMSFLLPTNTQIFLADWFLAARESGRKTELSQVPLGFNPYYYQAQSAPPFAAPLKAYAEAHRHDGPGEYAPYISHVLLAHAAQARAVDEAELPLEANHLERLGWVLNAVAGAPLEIRQAAIGAWFHNVLGLQVLPEALDFFTALMPHAEGVLQAVFAQVLTPKPRTT